jgi:hypothetical protein
MMCDAWQTRKEWWCVWQRGCGLLLVCVNEHGDALLLFASEVLKV